MFWSQIGLGANVALMVAYVAISASILIPLARTGQLWRNHLGFMTGGIFFSCGVGHAIHADHAVRSLIAGGWDAVGIDWHLGVWDAFTAMVALTYWRLRRMEGPPEDAGTMFEDLRRRQVELEQEAVASDLRAELAAEREVVAKQSFASVFASAPSGMALLDHHGTIMRVNPAFARIVQRDVDAIVGVTLRDLLHEDEGQSEPVADLELDGPSIEVRLDLGDGSDSWARVGLTSIATDRDVSLVVLEDITERRQAQARLNHLALHDPLTGLPNRLLFHDRATTALRQAVRTGAWTACLFVDLDHFKVVNDSLGHAAGDQVLKVVADRLVALLRPGDTVARMGGDEFCLLLQGLIDPSEAEAVADRVVSGIDGFVEIDGMQVTTGVSVGVAVTKPGEGVTSQTLVRDADTALYRAKGNGRGHRVLFDDALRDDAERRLRVEAELRRAITDGHITVAYQAQWSLARDRVVGVEALARWQSPMHGERLPDEFMDVAIESGLVTDIGRIVLETSLREFVGLRAAAPDLRLSVNMSSRQLGRPGFVWEVCDALERSGVPATALCLELTETDLTALDRSALATLHELRALGIKLAVDDVGTGQSSLTHLVTLPIDVIKIDRSFVDQVHVPGAKRAVVDALLSLARTIGVGVVAEGAETLAQLATLESLGCDVVQGFIISRPVAAVSFDELVRSRTIVPLAIA